jgi:hypothetical protein
MLTADLNFLGIKFTLLIVNRCQIVTMWLLSVGLIRMYASDSWRGNCSATDRRGEQTNNIKMAKALCCKL